MKVQEEKIEKFWNWFVGNESLVKNCIENESADDRAYIIDNLNNLILDIGMLTWDLGLDDSNQWFLTISPNCDKDLLEISQQIIKKAPYELDWNFYSSKPAKTWERKFSVYNDFMDEIQIDASTWYFVAEVQTDEKLKLIFEASNLKHLDVETLESAANIFLVHEIGEKERIVKISSIEILTEPDNNFEELKCSVCEIKKHFSI